MDAAMIWLLLLMQVGPVRVGPITQATIGYGATVPSACGNGTGWIDTDAADGSNWYACKGGTFVLQGSSAVGDIEGVTAGTGLSGGGTSGTVTVSLSTPVSGANGGTGADLSACGGVPLLTAGTAACQALGAGMATWWGTPSSANLRGALTDESGTGAALFQSGDLGTPTAGVLSSCTGYPLSALSGAGTGVLTGLQNAVTGSGGPVLATSPTITTPTISAIASATGVAFSAAATAPAQITTAQAGVGASLAATGAVAGASVAGAAAGGDVSVNAGDAARLTSGNANGGYIYLNTGVPVGTGNEGRVSLPRGGITLPAGSSSLGSLFVTSGQQFWGSGNVLYWGRSSATYGGLGDARVRLPSDGQFSFGSTTAASSTQDTGFERLAAGEVGLTDGSTGNLGTVAAGCYEQTSGDVTNATTTPANLTDLTCTFVAGQKLSGDVALYVSDDVAADGALFDFDGGTATMTNFIAHCTATDTTGYLVPTNARSAALATDVSVATLTGAALVHCRVSMVVNAAGTFIPRQAQAAHTTGTLTTSRGSHVRLTVTP